MLTGQSNRLGVCTHGHQKMESEEAHERGKSNRRKETAEAPREGAIFCSGAGSAKRLTP